MTDTPTPTTDPSAVALQRKVDRLIKQINGTAAALAPLVLAARADIDTIGENPDLTTEARLQRMEDRRQQLRDAVDAVGTQATDAEGQIEALVGAVWEQSGDVQAELLQETRLGRTWERIRRLLDIGEEPADIAQRAVDATDRIVFDAMRAELPDYLRAAGRDKADIEATTELLDDLETPLLTPEQAVARQALADAKRAVYFARMATGTVRTDLETADFIPGPTKDTDIHLSEGTVPVAEAA